MKLEAGQVALVTGASRGLGAEIARALAGAGLDLIIADLPRVDLEAAAATLCASSGRSVRSLAVDMADPRSVAALAEACGDVDVLVNNAGVEGARRYVDRSVGDIIDTIAINLTGPMLLAHALLPGMIGRGSGHIVNMASMAGLLGSAFQEPYSASKFGMMGFTRSLRMTAQACGWNVSASAICPGFIEGAGMFETLKQDYGVSRDGLDAAPIERVGQVVIEAIEQDLAYAPVTGRDPGHLIAMSIFAPLTAEALIVSSAATRMFRSVADAQPRGSGPVALQASPGASRNS